MIIVKLKGGLGNQMFQYAFGRIVALESNSVLKLDITGFKDDKVFGRKYSIACFNIIKNIATEKDLKKLKILTGKSYISKFIRLAIKIKPYYSRYVIYERKTHKYDSRIFQKKYQNVYFDGYWQNEKYFKDIEDIIRKEFILKETLKNGNLNLANKIQDTNSASIHLRKYDDIPEDDMSMLSLNYYHKAVKYLSERFNNLHFFIFSDNPEWAKKTLKLSCPTTFVEHNKNDKDYEDLRLMSLCKHQIIANSSFSWWAAWLNENTDKIVIAPKKWFRNYHRDTSDLIPNRWIQI